MQNYLKLISIEISLFLIIMGVHLGHAIVPSASKFSHSTANKTVLSNYHTNLEKLEHGNKWSGHKTAQTSSLVHIKF